MANIKSAQKRILIIAQRTQRNRARKSMVRTAVRHFDEAVETKSHDEARAALSSAYQALDKAAGKGTIHRNTAARKKARLTARLAKKTG